MPESGFLPQTHGRTTTPLANHTTGERQHGLSKAMLSQNGNHLVQIRCYGFTENVGVSVPTPFFSESSDFMLKPVRGRAYFGATFSNISSAGTYAIEQFRDH
jgi:hypothetical protein